MKGERRAICCFGRYEKRHDRDVVAGFVEILQIEGVVPDLITGGAVNARRAA